MRLLSTLGLACILAASAGCAAPTSDDDTSESADAISAPEAARRLGGSSKQLVDDVPASPATRALGVSTWTIFTVESEAFTGTVMFARDAEAGDVKYALVSRAADSKGGIDFALVNYDKQGQTGATAEDARVMQTLLSDMPRLKSALEAKLSQAKQDCALGLGIAAVSAAIVVAAGFATGAAIAAASALTVVPAWVITAIKILAFSETWVQFAAGTTAVWHIVDAVEDKTKSCAVFL